LVFDANKNVTILSNNHVLAGQPFTIYGLGSEITQLGPADLPMPPVKKNTYGGPYCNPALEATNRVATLTNYADIVETGTNLVDTADADADSSSPVSNTVLNSGVPSNMPWGPATKQLPIQLMARTSCYKTARIINTNATFLVSGVDFRGDYLANYHTREGDSGAVWFTQGSCPRAIAELFATTNGTNYALAGPINYLLSGLNVSMDGRACTAALTPQIPINSHLNCPSPKRQRIPRVANKQRISLIPIPATMLKSFVEFWVWEPDGTMAANRKSI
jgi:hypothetical protein